ncbi:MAG: hypothetical protein [Diaphorina citri cimodo-like virus]|nr:MAG: hypothetical protein [Diaphorina citri cimodo-like virus]
MNSLPVSLYPLSLEHSKLLIPSYDLTLVNNALNTSPDNIPSVCLVFGAFDCAHGFYSSGVCTYLYPNAILTEHNCIDQSEVIALKLLTGAEIFDGDLDYLSGEKERTSEVVATALNNGLQQIKTILDEKLNALTNGNVDQTVIHLVERRFSELSTKIEMLQMKVDDGAMQSVMAIDGVLAQITQTKIDSEDATKKIESDALNVDQRPVPDAVPSSSSNSCPIPEEKLWSSMMEKEYEEQARMAAEREKREQDRASGSEEHLALFDGALELLKTCEAKKTCQTPLDLHMYKKQIDLSTILTHQGDVIAAGYIKGCDINNRLPFAVIAKDDTRLPDYQGNNGAMISIVVTKDAAPIFNVKSARSEIIAIPLLEKVKGYRYGRFSNMFGTFQQIFPAQGGILDPVISVCSQFIMAGKTQLTSMFLARVINGIQNSLSARTGIKYVPKKMSKVFTFHAEDHLSTTFDLTGYPSIIKKKAHILPRSTIEPLPECLAVCKSLLESRKGLMHGSHVTFDHKTSQFKTPCDISINNMGEYWAHPCTVRARALGISKQMSDEVRGTEYCAVCKRKYEDKASAALCEVFCTEVGQLSGAPFGNVKPIQVKARLEQLKPQVESIPTFAPLCDESYSGELLSHANIQL